MLRGTYPGVYTREISSGLRPISGVPTAIAAFVGPSRTGIDNRPQRVLNFGDFERMYGGLASDSELSYSVMHFFQNGGGEAVVVRAPREGAVRSKIIAKNAAANSITFEALSSGASGDEIFLDIEAPAAAGKIFSLVLTHAETGMREAFSGLSTSAASLTYGKAVVNDPDLGSKLAKVEFAPDVDAPVSTGTMIDIGATDPAFFAQPETNAAKDYTVHVTLTDGTGDGADLMAKTAIVVIAQNSPFPRSHLGLAKLLEQKINQALAANLPNDKKGIEVEATLLDFGTAGKRIRLRVKVLSFQTSLGGGAVARHPAPDAIVKLEDDTEPTADDKLFAKYNLEAQANNVSRYKLGKIYGADLSFTADPVAGVDGSGPPTSSALIAGLEALRTVDIFNLVCIPDAVRARADNPEAAFYADYTNIYDIARKLCEDRRAFLLIDTPPNVVDIGQAQAWRTSGFKVRSSHAAVYFPRLKMSDPLNPGMLRAFPPSGAMAGVMARTDGNRGVWKAPAGIDAAVQGVFAPAVVMNDEQHGLLNPVGVNCVRKFPIYGSVAFGARTLAGADDEASEWKYVPVRRTALFILESLRRGLTWVTFEPNDEPTWSAIRMNVGAFMQGMFRQNAFQGRSPRDAYLVKCDAETTTQADINLGNVNVLVGFAPLKPAEFVFITLQQLVGQAQK